MRGRQDAVARRALVVPPYKNERCLKLEETIRAWARLRGLLRSPPMRNPIAYATRNDKSGCAVMHQHVAKPDPTE